MRWLIFVFVAQSLSGQTLLVNPGFEDRGENGMPVGWTIPGYASHYQVKWVDQGCKQGRGCVEMAPGTDSGVRLGAIEQSLDTRALAGKTLLFRVLLNVATGANAAVRISAQDAAGGTLNAVHSALRPTQTFGKWGFEELSITLPRIAARTTITVVVQLGRVVVDEVSVISGDAAALESTGEAASRLSPLALSNLTAFARLIGVVQYFHPSDQAVSANWDLLAIQGVRKLDYAATPGNLAKRMNLLLREVVPLVEVYVGDPPPVPEALRPIGKKSLTRWRGGERIIESASSWTEADLNVVDLGRGIRARVPLAVFRDEQGTLPHVPAATTQLPLERIDYFTGDDRATRLADVMLLSNRLRYSYPQLKDWDGVLSRTLQQAGMDQNALAFRNTLREMVATLEDVNSGVEFAPKDEQGRLPLRVDWVADRLVVTAAAEHVAHNLKPGDEIVMIGGKPAAIVVDEMERRFSIAAPQGKRSLAAMATLEGPLNKSTTIEIAQGKGQITLPFEEARGLLREIEKGIWYADLAGLNSVDPANVPKKLMIDLRGEIEELPDLDWLAQVKPLFLTRGGLVDQPEAPRQRTSYYLPGKYRVFWSGKTGAPPAPAPAGNWIGQALEILRSR